MSQYSNSPHGNGHWNRGGGWWRGRGRGYNYNRNHNSNYWSGRKDKASSQSTNFSGASNNRSSQASCQNLGGPGVSSIQTSLQIASLYAGWNLYFVSEQIELKGPFTVNFKELLADQIIQDGYPDIGHQMKNSPEVVLNRMGLAIHQVLDEDSKCRYLPFFGAPDADVYDFWSTRENFAKSPCPCTICVDGWICQVTTWNAGAHRVSSYFNPMEPRSIDYFDTIE